MFCKTQHFSKGIAVTHTTLSENQVCSSSNYLYCHFVPLLLDVDMREKILWFFCTLYIDNSSSDHLSADVLKVQGWDLPNAAPSVPSLAALAKHLLLPPCHCSQR